MASPSSGKSVWTHVEKMKRLLTPVLQDTWLMCRSLLPCFPLSLSLRAFARYG